MDKNTHVGSTIFLTSGWKDLEQVKAMLKLARSDCLSKHISWIVLSFCLNHTHLPLISHISNEMKLHINMLSSLMKN